MHTAATRRKFLQTASVICAAPAVLYANSLLKKTTIPQIGFLSGAGLLHLEKAFTEELQKLGYAGGENIHIEIRLARPNTNDMPVMAVELLQMNLSLIVAGSLPIAMEIRRHNPAMPMVIATCPGLVSNGFAKSLQHPGSIYTGMDELPEGVTVKRLQLLKAAAPAVSRIALLSTTPGVGGHEIQLSEAKKAAEKMGVEVKPYRAASLQELQKALDEIAIEKMNGLLVFQGALSLANRQLIVDFATNHHIPAIYQATVFAETGGLMAWAPDLPKQFREAAHYVDKILKGAKPGDLPAKHPEKYFLTLNRAAAEKIGLTFSKELLAEATTIL